MSSKQVPTENTNLHQENTKSLREELVILLPFFVVSLYMVLGSFQYKFQASVLPFAIGMFTTVLSGMRLIHIFFHTKKIGTFKSSGLKGEFDGIQSKIKKKTLHDHYQEEKIRITFHDELKAVVALISSFGIFLLLGYMIGTFFVIIGASYYYGFRKKKVLFLSLIAMYVILYGILHKLMGARIFYGIVLGPLLESMNII